MFGLVAGALASGFAGAAANRIFASKPSNDVGAPPAEDNDPASGFAQFGGLGDGFGKALGTAMSERVSNAFLGLPQPGNAKARGKMMRAYLNEAYPGTNAWEQLGASGGGAGAAAGSQNRVEQAKLQMQERIAEKQIAGQQKVAQTQAEATVQAATLSSEASRYGADTGAGASRYGADQSSAATRYASERPFREVEAVLNHSALRRLQASATANNWVLADYHLANTLVARVMADKGRQDIAESKARIPVHQAGAAEARARISLHGARTAESRSARAANYSLVHLRNADTAFRRLQADLYPTLAGSEIDRNRTSSVFTAAWSAIKDEGGEGAAWQSYRKWLNALGWILSIGTIGRGAGGIVNMRKMWKDPAIARRKVEVQEAELVRRAAGSGERGRSSLDGFPPY